MVHDLQALFHLDLDLDLDCAQKAKILADFSVDCSFGGLLHSNIIVLRVKLGLGGGGGGFHRHTRRKAK